MENIAAVEPVGGEGSAGDAGGSSSTLPVRARVGPDYFLVIYRFFSFITVVAAILCIAVNILAALQSFKHVSDIFDGIFRVYAVLTGVIVVTVQTEWAYIFKFWKVLEYWAGRGMLQIFFAVMTRAYPESAREKKKLARFQIISSYMLLSCGFIYIISGLLCIGFLKRARLMKEVSRERAIKDLENLARRREQLEAVLIEHGV